MSTLEERVQRLEDLEELRRLKIRYAQLCDANYDADGLAALFAEDAVWNGGQFGLYEGRDAIRGFFAGVSDSFTFALHYVIGHQIDIDSDTEAHGSWYILEPATIDDKATWIAAVYNDRYRKVDGRWMFAEVKVNVGFVADYEAGWAAEAAAK